MDQRNHSPIPFVQLLNEKGSLVCTADVNGILPYIAMSKMQLIESVSEFYVIDRSYMTKAEMKKVKTDSNGYGMTCSHNYTTEYWKMLNVPKLSNSLQDALDHELEMY